MSEKPYRTGTSSDGRKMHYSAGIMLEHDGAFVLFPRMFEPFGYAGPAGHLDEGETAEQAALRETNEELGLQLRAEDLILRYEEEVLWNACTNPRDHADVHHWTLYRATAPSRILRPNREEMKAAPRWYDSAGLRDIKLEPVWMHWFEKEGII